MYSQGKVTDGDTDANMSLDENLTCSSDQLRLENGSKKKGGDDAVTKSKKLRHSEQVSWWEKEGKYKR